MLLLNLSRLIRFAFQSFYRNIWLSLVTITIIFLTLLSLTSLIILNAATDQAILTIKNKIDISLYFNKITPLEQLNLIKSSLEKNELIKEVNFISAEEALEKFKTTHQYDTTVLEALNELEANPLGPTLTIKAKDVNLYPAILSDIKKNKIDQLTEEIDYDDHKIIIEKLINFSRQARQAGYIVSGIFALISLLIVFNTVRIGIYTHRDEIGIMKLVGASNWFVRLPFLLEGLFYALASTLVFWLLFYLLMGLAQSVLYKFFIDINFNLMSYLASHFIYIFGFELILIILLNTISGFIATSKYLKI